MKKRSAEMKQEMDKMENMVLKGVASAALKVTTANVRTCCWFVLGQDKLPDGAKRVRKF